jgi:DNA polymerase I-like protein with 3'-5' exonuclease and polymerase domains
MSFLLSFDLETHKIQPGLLSPPIVCGAFVDGPSRNPELLDRVKTLNRVSVLLPEPSWTFVGQNIAYDFGCVLAADPSLLPLVWKAYAERRVHDIGIAATLNAIAEGRLQDGDLFLRDGTKAKGRYTLDLLVKEWLGRDDAKENARFRTSYALLEGIPVADWPEDARQYPLDDALNTLQVAEAQLKPDACKNLQDLPIQAQTAFCLHLGALWGLRTNPEAVEAFAKATLEQQEGMKKTFQEKGLYRVGGTKKEPKLVKDTKLLKDLVTKAYLGSPPRTEKGDVSTDRVTLEESHDELLELFSTVSKVDKLATYIPALREASTKPLNVRPNVLLSSGRSSYEGLVQLMPRSGGVRDCFTPRPRYLYSSVDYAAVELVTLAQVFLWTVGKSNLANALNDGMDPHSLFAARMLEVSYEDFLKNKKEPALASKRQAAKAANFGFPGMMGAAKFVVAKRKEGMRVCELTHADGACGESKALEWKGKPTDFPLCVRCLEEAEALRRYYLEMWPEVRLYWEWVMQNMDPGDESLEQFISKRRRAGLTGPSGANTLFQGLAADGAKRAVIALTEEMYLDRSSPLYGSRLVVFAHDETILEVPEATAHEAAHRQAEVMIAKMKEVVPGVRVTAEPALMRKWLKGAETKYNEAGRLVPWEPTT